MKLTSIAESLAAVPSFEGIPRKYLDLISGCASNIHFQQGKFILLEGREARHFYVIREGKVAIETAAGNRNAITIETLTAGDVLGWSWLVPPYRWQFDARAVTAVSAIAFDAVCLREKCELDTDFGYEILKRFAEIMSQRLTATRMQIVDLYR